MSIHRNDKVVCVDDSPGDDPTILSPNGNVVAGQVYVVEGVSEDGEGLYIVGLPLEDSEAAVNGTDPIIPSWRATRFRKLSDMKKEAGYAKLLRDVTADPEGDALRSIGMTEAEIAAILGRPAPRKERP